jgi:membrane-associated phospholipid phosphatase
MQRVPTLRLLLALAALFLLAAAAMAGSGLDRPAFLLLNDAAAHGLPLALASSLTLLGHGLAAVMLLALLLQRAPQVLAAGLCAAPLGGLLSAAGKRLAASPRPAAVLDPAAFHIQGQVLAGNNAFPSGHSLTIFLVATVALLGYAPLRARWLAPLAVLALATLVAASRIMVGAHWPSDVLGGAALGILAGAAGDALARRWPHWEGPRARVVFALIVLACAGFLVATNTGYPLARPLQWVLAALGAGAALAELALRWRAARSRP